MSLEGQKDGFDGILIRIDSNQKSEKLKIDYAATHNAPLLISDNSINELSKNKMPVGYGEKQDSFDLFSVELQKNDTLYLFTDGFADQFGGEKGKKFKYKPLHELIRKNSNLEMNMQKKALLNEFNNWKGNLEQVDDVLIFGIKM